MAVLVVSVVVVVVVVLWVFTAAVVCVVSVMLPIAIYYIHLLHHHTIWCRLVHTQHHLRTSQLRHPIQLLIFQQLLTFHQVRHIQRLHHTQQLRHIQHLPCRPTRCSLALPSPLPLPRLPLPLLSRIVPQHTLPRIPLILQRMLQHPLQPLQPLLVPQPSLVQHPQLPLDSLQAILVVDMVDIVRIQARDCLLV